jgi:hypothetical protein
MSDEVIDIMVRRLVPINRRMAGLRTRDDGGWVGNVGCAERSDKAVWNSFEQRSWPEGWRAGSPE